ncbi:MAG: undecaprenyldiphospho-muramoylpentapeptide beta-N-acetylglucosaminyltransferase [Kiritimatiellales bacterium]|nr:undecaprenyldiphospho-muramoylpentapeptide beta-N-acetylglucosaminyltransferase [Kiritimatiellales bacterium]
MADKLKIAIACGGTGGHIFPGLATAKELVARGHNVTLWMAGKDIEIDAIKSWEGEVITIPAEGFQFGISFKSLKTIQKLFQAYRTALPLMRKKRPDVVLAMGSYASFGPVAAARQLKIPYVLHEANLLPGRAVSLLAPRAAWIATSFEKSRYYLKQKRIELTGMPLRRELQEASRRWRSKRRPGEPLRILVMGGSRGAQVLNEVVPVAIASAVKQDCPLEVEHIAGLQDTGAIESIYAAAGVENKVHSFVQNMETIYLNVDLAVCRGGASTCAELSAFGLPALLVPLPTAVRNHQMGNARALQDVGAVDVVAQEDLSATWLCDYLISIEKHPERLERMDAAMKNRARENAASKLADLLEKVAGGEG